jgi:flagellar basal body rod protein FlgB
MSSSKKSAPHRKAIAEAAQLAPITQKPGATKPTALNNTKALSKSVDLGGSDNNGGNATNDVNEDYETAKVVKNKKSQYEADIKMVQDLDRWG